MAKEGIFSGVLSAIKGNQKSLSINNTLKDGMLNKGASFQVPPQIKPDQNIEDIQQNYLDWQVSKIAHDLYARTIFFDTDRISSYNDFNAMDHSPEIAAALNIIRDECLTRNERGNILEIYSENTRIKDILSDLFKKVLNIEFQLKLWIRELVKHGDYFVLLRIDKDLGIYDFLTLPISEIHREEGRDGNLDSVRFRWETTGDYFEEWQVAHFRLIEDTKKLPYGRSLLEPARKLWKQLQLAEDAMLVYRITRAPERRVFYIETGNLGEADVKQYIMKMQNQLKKQPIVDSQTGQVNMKYNPQNITEDFFIPIKGDKSSKIETLPGASNLDAIADIQYFQNKLFAAIQVPKAYLNYSDALPGGSTLSQADLRFSRTINSIQEAVLMELRRIANIHLYFLGFVDDIDNFTLTLTNPSTQQELLKLETQKARLEVFKEFFTPEATSPASYTWAMENILGFSKSDIKLLLKQKKVEAKIFSEIEEGSKYKSIGLFKDLDKKYLNKDSNENTSNVSEEEPENKSGGEFKASSSLGNPNSGYDFGNTPSSETEQSPKETGAESLTESIDELMSLEKDKEIKKENNKLYNSNKKISIQSKQLLENIDKNLKNKFKEDMDIQIIDYVERPSLLESNEKNNIKTKEIFDKLDQIINETTEGKEEIGI